MMGGSIAGPRDSDGCRPAAARSMHGSPSGQMFIHDSALVLITEVTVVP